jgi:hypothetical protein
MLAVDLSFPKHPKRDLGKLIMCGETRLDQRHRHQQIFRLHHTFIYFVTHQAINCFSDVVCVDGSYCDQRYLAVRTD